MLIKAAHSARYLTDKEEEEHRASGFLSGAPRSDRFPHDSDKEDQNDPLKRVSAALAKDLESRPITTKGKAFSSSHSNSSLATVAGAFAAELG